MSTGTTLIKCTLLFLFAVSVCNAQTLENCTIQLNETLPQNCNRSLLFPTEEDEAEAAFFSTEELAELNASYAQTCTSACIDPIVQYYQCLSTVISSDSSFSSAFISNYENFNINFVEIGLCGQDENGEYCPVRVLRMNETMPAGLDTCPDVNSDFVSVCNSTTPQSCTDGLSRYSSRLGCCASSYLPPRLNCVTFDPLCGSTSPSTSTPSTSTPTSTPSTSTPTSTPSTSTPTSRFSVLS